MKNLLNLTSAATLALGIAATSGSVQANNIQAGTLTCDLHGKTNLVFYSKSTFSCDFTPAGAAAPESYTAEISNIGLDLEITETEQLIWAVLAPSRDVQQGALSGQYGGLSASLSAGGGLGAKVLIGGLQDSFTLQPLSISGSTGVGAAATLSGLTLSQAS